MVYVKKTTGFVGAIVILSVLLAASILYNIYNFTYTQLAFEMRDMPPGTPFETIARRYGKPTFHYADLENMKAWGPFTDPELLGRSEVFYFTRRGMPYVYVCVYCDKATGKVLQVTWRAL